MRPPGWRGSVRLKLLGVVEAALGLAINAVEPTHTGERLTLVRIPPSKWTVTPHCSDAPSGYSARQTAHVVT
jgi:hypothetical protein